LVIHQDAELRHIDKGKNSLEDTILTLMILPTLQWKTFHSEAEQKTRPLLDNWISSFD